MKVAEQGNASEEMWLQKGSKNVSCKTRWCYQRWVAHYKSDWYSCSCDCVPKSLQPGVYSSLWKWPSPEFPWGFAMMTLYAGIRGRRFCVIWSPLSAAVTARVLRTDPAIPSPKPSPCVVNYSTSPGEAAYLLDVNQTKTFVPVKRVKRPRKNWAEMGSYNLFYAIRE